MNAKAVWFAAAFVWWAQSEPATIRTLEIEHDDGLYELVCDTYLDAPREAIFEVLTDFDRFHRVSSVYKEIGYVDPAPDGTPMVYSRMEGCILFFCRSLRRLERVEIREPHFIAATALPEQSDFKYSYSEWLLEPEANGTKVIYRLTMRPDFWVPPLIGPWILKRTLLEGGERAVNRIERLARELVEEEKAAARRPLDRWRLDTLGANRQGASVSVNRGQP